MPLDQPLGELGPAQGARKEGVAARWRSKIANYAEARRQSPEQKAATQAVNAMLDALKAGHAVNLPDLVAALRETKAPGPVVLDYLARCKTPAELEKIHQQLATRSVQNVEDDRLLQRIQNTVARKLTHINPAMSPSLQAVLANAITRSSAEEYLHALGQVSAEGYNYEECHLVVVDAMAYLLEKKVVSEQDIARFFRRVVPGNELIKICREVHDRGFGAQVKTMGIARESFELRRTDAKEALDASLDQLKFENPRQFAEAVVLLAEDFGVLQSFGGTLTGGETTALRQKLNPLLIAANFEKLDEPLLRKLARAVRALQLPELAQGIDKALASKADPRTSAHWAISTRVLNALQAFGSQGGPSPADLLHVVKDAALDHARSPFARKRPLETELMELIGKLAPEDRRALGRLMGSAAMRELIGALREVGSTASVKPYSGVTAQLARVESLLSAARASADPLSAAGATAGAPSLRALSPVVREALEVLDLEVRANGTVNVLAGIAPAPMQTAVQAAVEQSIEQLGKQATQRPELLDEYDVLLDYVIDGTPLIPEGEMNKPQQGRSKEEAQKAVLDGAAAAVAQLCGGNEQMLHSLRTVASTPVIDAFRRAVLRSVHNPFRHSDGTPFEPGSAGYPSFNIRRDGKGGLVVTLQWRFPQSALGIATDAAGRTGSIVLDKPLRTGFSYAIAISPDGTRSPAAPLDFWQASKPPATVAELTHPNASAYAVDELYEFLKTEHSTENMDFIRVLNDFDKITTKDAALQRARQIVDEYIGQHAPTQINVASGVRQGVEEAVHAAAALTDDAQVLKQLSTAFDAARAEVAGLVGRDTFRRFLAQASENHDTNAVKELAPAVLTAPESQRIPPPVAPKEWKAINREWEKYSRGVRSRLRDLSKFFAEPETVRTAVATLGDDDRLLVTPHEQVKQELFKQHALECMAHMPLHQIVSLRYNLENTPRLKGDWHLEMLGEAAAQALKGTREGEMTPEGVLLKVARHQVDYALLGQWFENARVNEQEIASFFKTFKSSDLVLLASSDRLPANLLPIADRVIATLRVPIELQGAKLGAELGAAKAEWAAEESISRIAQLVENAASLAKRWEIYKGQCAQLGMRETEQFLAVRARAASLASALKAGADTPSLLPREKEELSQALLLLPPPAPEKPAPTSVRNHS